VSHVFTHFALTMRVVTAEGDADVAGEWWPVERVADAGLPTVFAKAAALAGGDQLMGWRNRPSPSTPLRVVGPSLSRWRERGFEGRLYRGWAGPAG
jgi:hypothetical protein